MVEVSRLAIAVGNSSVRGAFFAGDRLVRTWRFPRDQGLASVATWQGPWAEVWLASVVPTVTAIDFAPWWPHIRTVTLPDIPLRNLYPTLGIDRALALWGTWRRRPLLVVDGGTALTLTGVDGDGTLVGGAILPGLHRQAQTLAAMGTLPPVDLTAETPRWAQNTPAAVRSGILWGAAGAIAGFVQDWRQRFPDGDGVLTGGTGTSLQPYLRASGVHGLRWEPHAIFLGMERLWRTCSCR
ncbi:MAG: type III pantothenate kinase [Oscillatoriales cyanobacterium SM2_1_8]|nr:type III pantothenate kinase [Oscillatoriales cyanobacterium SM2_1_8]